ncbi:unnamed protein product [Angiostrongylus costaricensis]|uniref:Uncharacterized protein n=1 Tax=Angiostrongylus costaricensis TaxID=334426 RepID=A0A0R3PK28_ANGCS|nr:unnamed protein product [Angiostrongylus costaricensis]
MNGRRSISVAPPFEARSFSAPAPRSPTPMAQAVPLAVSFDGRLAKPQLSCFRPLCGLLDQLLARYGRRKAQVSISIVNECAIVCLSLYPTAACQRRHMFLNKKRPTFSRRNRQMKNNSIIAFNELKIPDRRHPAEELSTTK